MSTPTELATEERDAGGDAPASEPFEAAAAACAACYAPFGRFTTGYVRGKLTRDPVFRQLVERAPFAEPVVDLGCGRGQTGLLLTRLFPGLRVLGLDWDVAKLERARRAAVEAGAAERLDFCAADLRTDAYPAAGTLLMLDVLHYNPLEVQDAMLRRAARSLRPGGRLFLREVDAGPGWRSRLTRVQERIGRWVGFNRGATLCYRRADSIEAVLRDEGLTTRRSESWDGTPLANVLIEAWREPATPARVAEEQDLP